MSKDGTVPTDEEHEKDAREFVKAIDDAIAYALRHDPGNVFAQREALVRKLHELLSDSHHRGRKAERDLIRRQIGDLLR